MSYGLPESVKVGGKEYKIRSDFRAVLEVIEALNDPDLKKHERYFWALMFFYEDFVDIPQNLYQEAIEKCFEFIELGQKSDHSPVKIMDWKHDYLQVIAPINRVVGTEVRALSHFHWWSFVAAYMEIGGDCTFAQVIRIRNAKANSKQLDKTDREWYAKNRKLVDLETEYTQEEQNLLKQWGGG